MFTEQYKLSYLQLGGETRTYFDKNVSAET